MRTHCALGATLALIFSLAGCTATQQLPAGVTAREPGCVVELLRTGIPDRPVTLLATVRARCTGDIAADTARCERLLMDEGCRRGAQVLWQFSSTPLEGMDGVTLQAAAGTYR
ncbi:MAG: hypothetical protein Q8Q09_13865 [Deltaproteobacteria bacterium]|nr:hypothetical protein [Deltaproteobacteria bacterium]